MSTSGHLKFQGTNRATFVGATSNIMFDTTTTSLGIGVTGTDHPSSNLYITGNAYVSSNIAVGGVLTMGTVNVVARHDLESVTATGNITPLTVEFTNPTTSLVASGNVVVTGNVTADHFVGDGSNITGISSTLQAITDSGPGANVTSNTVQFSNAITSLTATSNIEVAGFVGSSGTGALNLPSGTTGEQPTGVVGMIRYNTTTNKIEYHTGTAWIGIGQFSATGGNIDETSAVYKIHKFESSGTFQAYSSGTVDILVVGGGGAGGGGRHAGGGGAGAVIHATSANITPGSYIITIGAGGSGAGGSAIPGNATNTTIVKGGTTLYSALRGGSGGTHPNPGNIKYEYGQDGGCGGGAGHSTTQTTTGYARQGLGLSATPAFGGNGGAGINRAATGAGGGAGANGGTGTGSESALGGKGGDGGIGYQSDITGTSLYWSGGGGGSGSPYTYRNNSSCTWRGGDGGNGGGGGGAAGVTTSASGARGGYGGAGYNAGSAGVKTLSANACHGGAGGENTGGGGGGAGGWSNDGNGNGGNGGKGIVVIRYLK